MAPRVPTLAIAIHGDGRGAADRAARALAEWAASRSLEVLTERVRAAAFQPGAAAVRLRIGGDAPECVWAPLDLAAWLPGERAAPARATLRRGAAVVIAAGSARPDGLDPQACEILAFPAAAVARAGEETPALFVGALGALLGFPEASIAELALPEASRAALVEGHRWVHGEAKDRPRPFGGAATGARSQLCTAASALARGLLGAGARVFVGVPEPGTVELLEAIEDESARLGLGARCRILPADTADAAAAVAVGASFAGASAVWVTSSSALARGAESLGFCGNAEIPLLSVVLQREASAAGLAPGVDQASLLAAIHGTGPGPRAVLAASDVRSLAWISQESLRCAEEHRIPALLLCDLSLLDRAATVGKDATAARRVTTREMGARAPEPFRWDRATEVSGESREGAAAAQSRKLETVRQALEASREMLGSEEGVAWEEYEAVALGWGASAGAVAEGVSLASREGIRALAVRPRALHPLPRRLFTRLRERFEDRNILVFEQNASGELARHLRAELGIAPRSHTKLDGRPLTPHDVLERLRELAAP